MATIDNIPEKRGSVPSHSVHDLIIKRWSPRAFDSRELSAAELNQLFEAMRWAPSSMNAQPWRMLYAFKGEESFSKIHDTLMEGNKPWAEHAPVLVLAMIKNTLPNGDPNGSAKHDLGLAVGNLLTQATSMGIGVHQMGGFSKEKAAEHFDLPKDIVPNTVLAIGYFGDPESLKEPFKSRETNVRKRVEISDFAFHGILK